MNKEELEHIVKRYKIIMFTKEQKEQIIQDIRKYEADTGFKFRSALEWDYEMMLPGESIMPSDLKMKYEKGIINE